MVSYFGLKPKSGEKEVAPSFVFMLWYEFCSDFKNTWNRENKNISKERWVGGCSPCPLVPVPWSLSPGPCPLVSWSLFRSGSQLLMRPNKLL